MALVVNCPGCRQKYSVPEQAVGRRVKCKSCGAVIDIPAASPVNRLPDANPDVAAQANGAAHANGAVHANGAPPPAVKSPPRRSPSNGPPIGTATQGPVQSNSNGRVARVTAPDASAALAELSAAAGAISAPPLPGGSVQPPESVSAASLPPVRRGTTPHPPNRQPAASNAAIEPLAMAAFPTAAAAPSAVPNTTIPVFEDPVLKAPLKTRHGKRRPKGMNSAGKAMVAMGGICLLSCVILLIVFFDDITGSAPKPKSTEVAVAKTDVNKTNVSNATADDPLAKAATTGTETKSGVAAGDSKSSLKQDLAAKKLAGNSAADKSRSLALADRGGKLPPAGAAAAGDAVAEKPMLEGEAGVDGNMPVTDPESSKKLTSINSKAEKVFSSGKPDVMMDGDEVVEDLDLTLREDPLPKQGAEVTITRDVNLRMSDDQDGTPVAAGSKVRLGTFADDQVVVTVIAGSGSKVAGLVAISDIDFGDKQVQGDDPGQRNKLREGGIQTQHHPEHHLVDVVIGSGKMTDELMQCIEGLPHITKLVIDESEVTDEGLRHVRKLNEVRTLDLRKTKISDEGLKHLAELQLLRIIDLRDTDVSLAAIERLQQNLPRAKIRHSAT